MAVRHGIRDPEASLTRCVACHAVHDEAGQPVSYEDERHFCRACHMQVAIAPDCFSCHLSTPMIPGWGFGLSNRGGQFNLDPTLANVVAPGKRPRNTNTPFIIMKDGKPFL